MLRKCGRSGASVRGNGMVRDSICLPGSPDERHIRIREFEWTETKRTQTAHPGGTRLCGAVKSRRTGQWFLTGMKSGL